LLLEKVPSKEGRNRKEIFMQRIISKTNLKVYGANGDDHAPYRLVEEIIARSIADAWQDAKREWVLDHVFFADPNERGTCLCGHFPIVEQCVLLNRKNGNEAVVGNVCVTRFMGIPAEKLFTALRRIIKNKAAPLNTEVVEYAYCHGWIDDWKRRFYLNTCRVRKLSFNQRAKRVEINELILYWAMEGR
jgi:hypothetical protein